MRSIRHHALSAAAELAYRPRAMLGKPRAADDPATVIRNLTNGFEDFKARHNGQMTHVQTAIDDISTRIAGRIGGPGLAPLADDPEYTRIFASWVKRGDTENDLRVANTSGQRSTIQAAMSQGSGADGGYLVPTEWDRKIITSQLAMSPMRRLASIVPTTVQAYTTVWTENGWGSGWVGETAGRPTTTTPQLSVLNFSAGELYAYPGVTQRLLDDTDFDGEAWLTDQVVAEFGRQESIAFISGDGVNKPQGLLTYINTVTPIHPGGALDVVVTASAGVLLADELVTFLYGLGSPYRQKATWLMNSSTAAVIAKMKDGEGAYIWREAFMVGQPATLLGFPVAIDENMPAPTAGNIAIAFGDFAQGYVINDRMGIRVLRDPYTNKPYVMFYVTKRVGGGVRDPRAVRLLRIKA